MEGQNTMTMGNVIDGTGCRFGAFEIAKHPLTGEAALVFVPAAVWERVPQSAREAAGNIDIALGDGNPVYYQLPVATFDELCGDIEAAADLLLTESAQQIPERADAILTALRSSLATGDTR